jgi:putative endonuclease
MPKDGEGTQDARHWQKTQRLILAGLLIQSEAISRKGRRTTDALPQGVEHFDSLRRRGKIHTMRWTSHSELRLYSTYILSNTSMTLYIGVTNNLARRISQHKKGRGSGFTSRYHFDRLVYFEQTPDIRDAIAREKVLKGWSRKRKIELVKTMNPTWSDLSADWLE